MSSVISSMLEKCDIYYDNALISKESIIEKYFSFCANLMVPRRRTVGLALHTGSVCFDVISVVAVGIGCLGYNLSRNDDILKSLCIDDIVLYKGKRYRWKGIGHCDDSNLLYIKLERDGRGKDGPNTRCLPYDKNKHLISRYNGKSKKTDGRGVKRSTNSRGKFLSNMFGIPISEVPTQSDISVVVVSARNVFADICNKVHIKYNGVENVSLIDIIPMSYFTNIDVKYQLGSNPTKAEPVIKVTGNISTARDLVLNKNGNKVIGLLVIGDEIPVDAYSEISDLLRRKSLKFALLESPLQSGFGNKVLESYDDISVFACTKEYLAAEQRSVRNPNKYTEELFRQISTVANNMVVPEIIDGGIERETYLQIRRALLNIKQSNWHNDLRYEFIVRAQELLNLFNTAIFSMKEMESSIENGKVRLTVVSPQKRIEYLRELSNKVGTLQDLCVIITNILEQQYNNMLTVTPKGTFLRNYIAKNSHSSNKIAVIVPKAYYADIMDTVVTGEVYPHNVTFITPSRFETKNDYDTVIVVGEISKFDPLNILSSTHVRVLLYEGEEEAFAYRKKKVQSYISSLNTKIGISDMKTVSSFTIKNEWSEQEIQEFSSLDEYIDNFSTFDVYRFAASSRQLDGTSPLSEVTHVGTFTSGERILISKYYSAVVFDVYKNKGIIIEKSPSHLVQGDVLVFTKRNNYTQNIVDVIYERLLKSDKMEKQSAELYEKSQYWKKCLREYKNNNKLEYSEVVKKLGEHGSTLKEGTVRQWLAEGSHIVGPKNINTMEHIALVTQDPYLLSDSSGYFEACRIVRQERKKILKRIEKAINDKLVGFTPQKGSIDEFVYNNIEKLSETKELAYISELSESVNVNSGLVNRPITEAEVSP